MGSLPERRRGRRRLRCSLTHSEVRVLRSSGDVIASNALAAKSQIAAPRQ